MTEPKSHTAKKKLAKGTSAVLAHMQSTGDSISGQFEAGRQYWGFTRSGLPVRPGDVLRLKEARLIEPCGAVIDPASPAACYVLARIPAEKQKGTPNPTECGARSIQECTGAGLCLDCAPGGMVKRIREGKDALPSNWKGIRP